MKRETWYRYSDIQYSAGVDEFDNVLPGPGRVEVYCEEYLVAKHTSKGVWLSEGNYFNDAPKDAKLPCDRFVLKDARKRFACPTKKEAMESFLARKNAQLRILGKQIYRVERAIEKAKRIEVNT